MKQLLRNLKVILVLFIVLAFSLLVGIVYHQYKSNKVLLSSTGESKEALAERFAHAGTVYSADDVELAFSSEGERHYCVDRELAAAFLQTVGDYTQNITNTIESSYQDHLTGGGRAPWYQLMFDFTGKGLQGDDIHLTLNSELTRYAYRQLGDRRGSIVVLNYKTGEVQCMVSTPSTDPWNVITYEDIPDTALFNRSLLSSYKPGSTFKIVTGTAWLSDKNFDPNLTVLCKGSEPLFGVGSVTENTANAGHGEIQIEDAYAYSCNHFFGTVAATIGGSKLEQQAEKFGYNQALNLDRLHINSGEFQLEAGNTNLLTWQAIGQPLGDAKLFLSPMQMAMIAGAIANDGQMLVPHVIKYMVNPLGFKYEKSRASSISTVTSPEIAKQITKYLKSVVAYGTGIGADRADMEIAGKTGTAEYQRGDGEIVTNSLFTGFIADSEHPYAVAVVLEDSEGGAADIAGGVLAEAKELGE